MDGGLERLGSNANGNWDAFLYRISTEERMGD